MSMNDNSRNLIFSPLLSFTLAAVLSGNVASMETMVDAVHATKTKTYIIKTSKARSSKIYRSLTRGERNIKRAS